MKRFMNSAAVNLNPAFKCVQRLPEIGGVLGEVVSQSEGRRVSSSSTGVSVVELSYRREGVQSSPQMAG